MKYLFFLCLIFFAATSIAQKPSATFKGRAEIGPLCPAEPCNISKKEKKEIYQSYEVILLDTSGQIQYHIPIDGNAKFQMKINPGNYTAIIKPLKGRALRAERFDFSIRKNEVYTADLRFDTGIR